MNNNPIVPQTVRTEKIKVTSAALRNAAPTNKLFTAGSNGSRIERIEVLNAYPYFTSISSNPAARVLRIYLLIDGVYYLYRNLWVTFAIPLVPTTPNIFNIPGGLNIQPGVEVWVSQSVWTAAKDDTAVIIYAKDF